MTAINLPPETVEALAVEHIDDLLTDEQKADLYADLAEIAATRRRGEAMAANWVLGSKNGSTRAPSPES